MSTIVTKKTLSVNRKRKNEPIIKCGGYVSSSGTFCKNKASYYNEVYDGTWSNLRCHAHKNTCLPDYKKIENEEKKQKRLKKECPKYMKFENGRLSPVISNDIMVNIIHLITKDSIYYWTLLRCVNKLWKKYIDKCITKPDYCVFRMLYRKAPRVEWEVWKFKYSYKSERIEDATEHFKKNNGRTFDHRMILFIFMSIKKDEMTITGNLKKTGKYMENVHNHIVNAMIKKRITVEDIELSAEYDKVERQKYLYPRQYQISLDQYNDIKKKDSKLMKIMLNAKIL
jgi:hypothetical protein